MNDGKSTSFTKPFYIKEQESLWYSHSPKSESRSSTLETRPTKDTFKDSSALKTPISILVQSEVPSNDHQFESSSPTDPTAISIHDEADSESTASLLKQLTQLLIKKETDAGQPVVQEPIPDEIIPEATLHSLFLKRTRQEIAHASQIHNAIEVQHAKRKYKHRKFRNGKNATRDRKDRRRETQE